MSNTESVIGMPRPVSRTWSRHEFRQSVYVDRSPVNRCATEQLGDDAVTVTVGARGRQHVEIVEPLLDVETGSQDRRHRQRGPIECELGIGASDE